MILGEKSSLKTFCWGLNHTLLISLHALSTNVTVMILKISNQRPLSAFDVT